MSSEALLSKSLKIYGQHSKIHEWRDFPIARPKGKKPYLITEDGEKEHFFSVSHSKQRWICGIQDMPLGVDIELPRMIKDYEALAKRFYTQSEYDYTMQYGLRGFFKIWVRKEAYIKFTGKGIAQGLKSFSVVKDGNFVSCIETPKQQDAMVHFEEWEDGYFFAYCAKDLGEIEKIKI